MQCAVAVNFDAIWSHKTHPSNVYTIKRQLQRLVIWHALLICVGEEVHLHGADSLIHYSHAKRCTCCDVIC